MGGLGRLAVGGLLAVALACGAGMARAEALPPQGNMAAADRQQAALAVFDEVWDTARTYFYDPAMHGLDWEKVKARYRPEYAAAAAPEQPVIINRMLAELKTSHTGYYTRDEPAYYQLMDIFGKSFDAVNKQQAARPGALPWPHPFQGDHFAYEGLGLFTSEMSGSLFVTGVLEGYPADKAGLRAGDEIMPVNGAPFSEIAFCRGKADQSLSLSIRRNPDERPQPVTVTPVWISPNEAFLKAMEVSATVSTVGGRRIGYVHVWSYAGNQYQHLLEQLMSVGVLKDADALIWDLRDGWGGAQPGYLDVFSPLGPTMEMISRDGKHNLLNVKWRRLVALLIDERTRSGKEVLAYGFKKYGVGPVIGTTTAKAVMAARGFVMADGSLLELAVDDVLVDGEHLEGIGVNPTIEVHNPIEYTAAADPQRDRAVEELVRIMGQ